MSNYTKSTNFATKDNLSPGDPLKIVRGTEIDTEFNNISTAISTKTDNSAAAITGGSITGITDLAVADGGTGASTATAALNNLLPSQTGNSSKYLQTDGTNATWDAISINTGDITGTLPVANGGTGVTSSTGTGSVVLSNSPTLVTPALGTPASGVATNLTGLPISTGVSGLGTGVATFLGTPSSANLASAVSDETGSGALVFANSPTLVTPALGTPSALVGTNITGTASGLTAGNVTTNANLTGAVTSVGNATSLGSFSSANLLGALTDETGTGSAVFATSPTLVTPILGTPTSATLTNATGLPIATGVSGLGTGVATFLATPSSANLRSALTDETGTGSAVFATSPTLVTPVLGTPTSGTLTNCTGLPNAGLVNSSITIGGTAIALGASSNTLANDITVNGLTVGRGAGAVSSNTAVGASALAANTTGSGVTAFGYNALNLNTSGTGTAVGWLALAKATTADGNTALGPLSLYETTTGSYNTAVGLQSLQNNTTASNNTAVGYQAGYTNVTGTQSTFVGFQSGYSSTAGFNTAIGYLSGYAITSGSGNTAVGRLVMSAGAGVTGEGNTGVGNNTLANLTGGSQNTSIGDAALTANTTGSFNTALGVAALRFNTTASNNTAVGYQAGYSNTTGVNSVYLGIGAGKSITTASDNCMAGYYAGESTTGGGNTFFGKLAGNAVTSGAKNTIIGSYNGNQGGLDIRTANNYIVLSDGDGNPRLWHDGSGTLTLKPNAATTNIGYGFDNAELYPFPDNNQSLGLSSFRWTTVYATTALINTSDANLKQQIRSLDVAEKNVAQAIKGLIKAYKFNDAVAKKGDGARIHIGAIAQEVQAAFVAEGLDPNRYAMFCSDTWYEVDGKPSETAIEPFTAETPNAVEVTRLGLRYEELLAFVISTL